jgi:hypothetical protein
MLDQGTLQAIPSQEEYLIGRVETFETYAAHAVSAELARFEPQGHEAKSLVTVTLSIPESEYATVPSLIARFVPRDAAKLQRILGEGSFHVEGSGADRVTQGRLFLDPGTYDVTLLVADPEGRSNGIQRSKVDVPVPRTGLRLSDVVLASVLDPVAYASLASYEEPYFLGSFRVVPRMGRRLRRGDAVNVFYEIYGGSSPYRIVYRIEGKEDDGRFTPLGSPVTRDQAEGAQGWSLPTGDRWPAGDYRVRIEVTDAASGSATATVPFTLAPREQP